MFLLLFICMYVTHTYVEHHIVYFTFFLIIFTRLKITIIKITKNMNTKINIKLQHLMFVFMHIRAHHTNNKTKILLLEIKINITHYNLKFQIYMILFFYDKQIDKQIFLQTYKALHFTWRIFHIFSTCMCLSCFTNWLNENKIFSVCFKSAIIVFLCAKNMLFNTHINY